MTELILVTFFLAAVFATFAIARTRPSAPPRTFPDWDGVLILQGATTNLVIALVAFAYWLGLLTEIHMYSIVCLAVPTSLVILIDLHRQPPSSR